MDTMTDPFAVLPMYDWPEIRELTDGFWTAIRHQLAHRGLDAPDELTRPSDLQAAWTDDALVVGHTCGLPLVTMLPGTTVVGAFDHRLPDTPPGWYHSVVIVATDDPATSFTDLGGATVAINGADSQSGHAAWRHELATGALGGEHLGRPHISGGHRASIVAVAEGIARTAAIDGVSWELARLHEPAAAHCRVLHRTAPAPALPVITNQHEHAVIIHEAIAAAIGELSPDERHSLHVHAIVPATRDDYDIITRRWAEATAAGVPELT